MELKEYFNKEAGPGTYSENASTVESSVQSELKKLQHFDGTKIIKSFDCKQKRFVPTSEMLQHDPKVNVAPGQYEPKEVEGHKMAPRMDYKGDFSLPFNENNPLNYVKPITVNIYFKQKTPGVGQYYPQVVEKNPKTHSRVFQSKTQRGVIDKQTLKQLQNKPGPGAYDPMNGFDVKQFERDQGTRHFCEDFKKQIIPINIYDPSLPPEDEKNKRPDCYNIHRLFDKPRFEEDFEPRLDHVPGGGKIYTETNLDRFGQPIRPLKPINIIPGPGEYETTDPVYDVLGPKPAIARGGFIPEDPADRTFKTNKNVPGPGAYQNSKMEPNRISFLFNPTDRWVPDAAERFKN